MAESKQKAARKTVKAAGTKKKKVPAKEESAAVAGELVKAPAKSVVKRAESCRRQLRKARERVNESFFDMAVHLREAYDEGFYTIWTKADGTPFASFEEYCETELDISYRTGKHLVDIGRVILKYGLSKEKIAHIGWAKMAQIARPMLALPEGEEVDSEVERMLGLAEEHSLSDLKDLLRTEAAKKAIRETAGEEGVPGEVKATKARKAKAAVMRMTLKFEALAAETVADALQEAYKEIGSDEDPHEAFHYICSDWLRMKQAGLSSSTLEEWVDYIGRQFGVELQVVGGADEAQVEAVLEDDTSGGEVEVDTAEEIDVAVEDDDESAMSQDEIDALLSDD